MQNCSTRSWSRTPRAYTASEMAKIIGGIGTSHVPTIAMAFDKGKQNDPDWMPLFKGYEPVAQWLAEKKPDVLFFCFNDHATALFPVRTVREKSDRGLSGGSEGRDGRHRRLVAPDDRRARRLQQREMGPRVPRAHRARPGAPCAHVARGVHGARRK